MAKQFAGLDRRLALKINGFQLPRSLLDLIETGRWRSPADESGLNRLFPVRSEFCCYTFAAMEGETQVLYRQPGPTWRGTRDSNRPPGDVDPTRTVLIADLGLGYDQPIALDFRLSIEHPRVLTLCWDKPAPPVPWKYVQPWREGKRSFNDVITQRLEYWCELTTMGGWNRWIEIAPDFETFARLIGIV